MSDVVKAFLEFVVLTNIEPLLALMLAFVCAASLYYIVKILPEDRRAKNAYAEHIASIEKEKMKNQIESNNFMQRSYANQEALMKTTSAMVEKLNDTILILNSTCENISKSQAVEAEKSREALDTLRSMSCHVATSQDTSSLNNKLDNIALIMLKREDIELLLGLMERIEDKSEKIAENVLELKARGSN